MSKTLVATPKLENFSMYERDGQLWVGYVPNDGDDHE